MTTKELKEKYIKFFQSKGHAVIPSASLIPENDPTVLFTTAGMQPLVPYLLGEKHPSGSRLVDVQKCMRTGDIEEVGDNVHLTFFEMLGNWSLGDYWKKESITWSFEFLTKELRIPIGKLAVSCFAGDENASKDVETAEVWKSLGIPEGRIYFLSRKDNWWGPVGNIGPCGPDTEVFYWTGEDKPSDLTTSDNKEGWVEIWNNVFMQYEKTSSGKYAPLKQKNVDTGMGVERTTAILNGKDNVFNVNELNLITDEVKKVSTKEDERSLRIVVDHLRASTFILGDQRCIAPSNVDQGYVLRRLIRRAIRHGKMLGITKPFLVGLSRIVVDEYSSDYPELKENQNFIEKYLGLEEEKFTKTLNEGQKESFKKIKMLLDLNEKVKVSGFDVLKAAKISFDLYQSSGYPLEMFLEDLKDKKGLDKETSDKICKDVGRLISSHQSISRAGSEKRFKGGLSDQSDTNIKYHTATHLLNMALRKVLGDHVRQIGSNITKERLRFDFPNPVKLTEDQVKEVEKIVNDIVDRKIPVGCIILPKEEAIKKGVTYLQGEQYPDQVKVYFVGNDLDSAESKELCGGPHVSNTRDLDHIEVFKQDKIGEGKMRVYARFK
ncbi:alanine--tRNA ligase [candidate division WWE3 bacterium]|uniref:alanine--tRNA ligase n=1 Tax=candidate division WWE3 bacterium TaxID=2053526 RepID=A0A7X9E6A9_UNCKA|nr:alanine--tRNA ligase [candidate division WWE3 bacterium]